MFGLPHEKDVVMYAAQAAILDQVVIVNIADHIISELTLDEAHDPFPVADHVVFTEIAAGIDRGNLAIVGEFLINRHEQLQIVAANDAIAISPH